MKLELIPNYVDAAFEQEVLKLVPKIEKKNSNGVNQTLRWGSNNGPYRVSNISTDIPEIFLPFKDKFEFNMVGINEYHAGQLIDWHIDHASGGEQIRLISLLSEADLKFKRDNHVVSYTLPRYSYCMFEGELRWGYKHSLYAPEYRVSIVFRNIV